MITTMDQHENNIELRRVRVWLDDKAAVCGTRPRFKPKVSVGSLTRSRRGGGLTMSMALAGSSSNPLLVLLLGIPLLISSLVISDTNCDQLPIASEATRGQFGLDGLRARDAADSRNNSQNIKSTARYHYGPDDHHYNHHDHQHHRHNHNHHQGHHHHHNRNRRHTHAKMVPNANHHHKPHQATSKQQQAAATHHHHHNRRPLWSESIVADGALVRPLDSRQPLERMKRHQPAASGGNFGNHDPDTMRVAALASKLEHWLQCQRFAMAGNQPIVDSSSSAEAGAAQSSSNRHQHDYNSNSNNNDKQAAPDRVICGAHFDGHLCWPPAKLGQRIQLRCPKLNWLPKRPDKGDKGADINQQPKQLQIQAAKTMMSTIQQPQPTVRPAAVSSPILVKVTTQDGDEQAAASSGATNNSRTAANSDQPLEMGELEIGFAWRRCEANPLAPVGLLMEAAGRGETSNVASNGSMTSAKWQDRPDYSQCQSVSSNQLQDPTDEWIKLDEPADRQLFADLAEGLERIEANIDPYAEPDIQEHWSLCIGEIMRQQQRQLNGPPPAGGEMAKAGNSSDQHCPIIFDGWRCWPKTRAGEVAYVSCPSNQPGFIAERKAHKICTPEADWYRHPMTNRYWSNYTTCVDTVDLAFRTKILNLYVIGNLISLIALTVSLIIFISFKSLNCTRVTIHKNLFLSFITNNFMWIIWYTCVVNDAGLLQSNPIECRIWHILLHYFLVSNYFWMFCEGLYLHTLLVVAFVSEDKILKWFYLLGWLTPLPITIGYAYNRSYDDYYTNFCWMEESPHNIILMAPIGFSLLLNLVFLINIVRVLVTKLRANNSPDTHQTRKAVRATLILIPLLGLHYMLTPFRPEAKSEWETIYEIVAAVCTSFQGLCVAMLFCFFNGEVISVVKKKLKDTFLGREPMRGRSGTKNGSLAFLANNDHHPASKCHRLETSLTLRSVVSSSSNGDLIARAGLIQANKIGGFGATAYNFADQTTALIGAGTTSFNIITNGTANGPLSSNNNHTKTALNNDPTDNLSRSDNNNSRNNGNHSGDRTHSHSVTSSLITNVTASPISNHRGDLIDYTSQQQQQQQQQLLLGSARESSQLVTERDCILGDNIGCPMDPSNGEAVKLL